MAVYHLPTIKNSEVLIELVKEHKLSVGGCIDLAVKNDNLQSLTFECKICCRSCGLNKMVKMILCDDIVCRECFVSHYSLMIKEKSIKHLDCLVCGEPDISSGVADTHDYLQKFSALIQAHLSEDQYNMFMQKLAEHAMSKDPNFRWCVRCCSGCIYDKPKQRVECPECKQQMCFYCHQPWEDQHVGLTCEEFTQWKKNNDPEVQAQGLAVYLNKEGIVCPACKFTYALARGGCMHFKCTQCPAEFCGGCSNLFTKDCTKYQCCFKRGLHAHHPRDCLFYLREENIEDLQKLLNDNNVEFDTEPPEGQVMAEAKKEIKALQGQVAEGEEEYPVVPPAAAPVLKCHIMLQKETPDGPPIDEECGDAVQSGHAGLCKKHYKEYLVFKINQNHIDPLPLVNEIRSLRAVLIRDEVKVPDQQPGEEEEQYAERLKKDCTK